MKDCVNKDKCQLKIVIEMLANIGGRTTNDLPNCEECNVYKGVEQ